MECDEVFSGNSSMFLRNLLPPSSGSKNIPSKLTARINGFNKNIDHFNENDT